MAQGMDGQDPIAKSRQTLAAWEWMSTISRRPDELVRLLQSEMHALETLALEQPRNAAAAAQLIAAYQKLMERVQRRIETARSDRRVA